MDEELRKYLDVLRQEMADGFRQVDAKVERLEQRMDTRFNDLEISMAADISEIRRAVLAHYNDIAELKRRAR